MQITDTHVEVWDVEDLKLVYDTQGEIKYGYQPNGFYVISGQNGPEAKGWPGIVLKPGLKVLRSKEGRIRPVTDEQFAELSHTKEFTPQPETKAHSTTTAPPPPLSSHSEERSQKK